MTVSACRRQFPETASRVRCGRISRRPVSPHVVRTTGARRMRQAPIKNIHCLRATQRAVHGSNEMKRPNHAARPGREQQGDRRAVPAEGKTGVREDDARKILLRGPGRKRG